MATSVPCTLTTSRSFRPNRVTHDLCVRLRHRLLRQPHGFEGFLARLVEAEPEDRAATDLPVPGAVREYLDPTPACDAVGERRHHVVAGVNDLLNRSR
jgi:hypothetical protein